ncbi:MAG: hypothetical protein AAB656_03965 [Patescibacteria group bacterium]
MYRKILIVIGIVIFAGVIVVAVFQSQMGSKLVYMEEKYGVLEAQNRELASKVIVNNSLTKIGEGARGLGMDKPENVVYLNREPAAVAQLP